jgi:hypothetical protein
MQLFWKNFIHPCDLQFAYGEESLLSPWWDEREILPGKNWKLQL